MPKFATAQEETIFWKKKYEELEKEYEEYMQNSQMIEKELEMSLEQAEKMNRDLKTRNNHLVLENETLKVNCITFILNFHFRVLSTPFTCRNVIFRKSLKKTTMILSIKSQNYKMKVNDVIHGRKTM